MVRHKPPVTLFYGFILASFFVFLTISFQFYHCLPFFPGVLLLYVSLHIFWSDGRVCQVRDHGYRSHHGRHDPGVSAPHGPHRPQDPASVRARGNVHILHLHYHLVSHKGVSYLYYWSPCLVTWGCPFQRFS